MKKHIHLSGVFILIFAVTILTSRSFRVNQIPNGSTFACANCHVSSAGGGARNDFGSTVEASFLSGGNVVWNATLAAMDSDGDGVSNGEELQDPNGEWTTGSPAPGNSALVTNPGDPTSFVPVELATFAATVSDGKVNLVWRTATESNNAGFSVEKSTDETSWNEIAFIDGNGTTTEPIQYYFTDEYPSSGVSYYRLVQQDYDGTEKVYGPKEVNVLVADDFSLAQNYPNPFNPSTTIAFTVPETSNINLDIYNSLGERVASLLNESVEAGKHTVQFNASDMPSGIYFARLSTTNFAQSIKMMLIK